MANKNKRVLSESEIAISKLTGQFNSDKTILVLAIHKLRETNGNDAEIKVLGEKLYHVLLENGLNESDVINPSRLLGKIDGFLYEKNYEMAMNLIEVLDSLEFYEKKEEKGNRILYVRNPLEALIAHRILGYPRDKEINWVISLRSVYALQKADIYSRKGDKKSEQKEIQFALKLNPASFFANVYQANLYREDNLEKYKKNLQTVYNVCYSNSDLVQYLKDLSFYYERKKEFTTAYATMFAVSFFTDISLVQSDLDRLLTEANKNQMGVFLKPTVSEIERILKRDSVPTKISEENFQLIVDLYLQALVESDDLDPVALFCEELLRSLNVSAKFIKDLQSNAKKGREKYRKTQSNETDKK